jgi:hypothetical protein
MLMDFQLWGVKRGFFRGEGEREVVGRFCDARE